MNCLVRKPLKGAWDGILTFPNVGLLLLWPVVDHVLPVGLRDGGVLPFPGLNLVLLHLERPLDPVQLAVEAARVADGVSLSVPPPEGRLLCLAIDAGRVGTQSGATVL